MKRKWMKIEMAFLAVVFLAALIGITWLVASVRASDGKGPTQQAAGTDSAGPSDAKGTMQKAAGTEVDREAELKGISPQAEKAAQERAQKYENLPAFNPPPALKEKAEEAKKKRSYAVGVETGRNYLRQKMALDTDEVAKGLKDVLTGGKLEMSNEEMLEALNEFSGDWRARRGISQRLEGYDNRRAGLEFLAENKTREGVVTLPDELQYKIIKEGTGTKPTDNDTVAINYRGMLVDGTEFVNTAGIPETFRVNDSLHLVVGLRKALKMMPVGSRWEVFIPDTQAFGWRPAGELIGPNSTLIYEVELVSIK